MAEVGGCGQKRVRRVELAPPPPDLRCTAKIAREASAKTLAKLTSEAVELTHEAVGCDGASREARP